MDDDQKQSNRTGVARGLPLLRTLLLSLICLTVSDLAMAQPKLTVGGQVRPRFEAREPVGRSFDSFTSMRLRAQVRADLERNVSAFVQIQDVRLWGDATNTLFDFSGDNIDLHQGYIDFNKFGGSPISARVGRQEINFGGQRLIGAVGWTQQARSFDGLRIFTTSEKGRLDLIAFKLAEATSGTNLNDAVFLGTHGTITSMEHASLDLYFFLTHKDEPSTSNNTNQGTLGFRYAGNRRGWVYRFETSYQLGKKVGQDVSAYLIGARLGRKIRNKVTPTIWYDYISGDDDPTDGKVKVFDTLFGTNHKFYGLIDLFLNIPVHTAGLGLQNIALKTSIAAHKDVSLNIDVHSFLLAKKGPQTSTRLGEEIDLTVSYRYAPGISFVGGFSYFFQASALAGIGRLGEDSGWGYMMTNVAF